MDEKRDAMLAELAVDFAMMEMMRQMIGDLYQDRDRQVFRDKILQFQDHVLRAINDPPHFRDGPDGLEDDIKQSASLFVRTVLSSLIQANESGR